MRRLALAGALAAVAACASAPRAARTERGVVLVGLALDYEVDVAHPWESGRSANDLISQAMDVMQRRVHAMFGSGRVLCGDNDLTVQLPNGTAEQYETFQRIAPTSGRFRVALVDENSAYMQALARRLRDEPLAGIEVREDRWRHPGRGGPEHEDVFLAAEHADDLATAVTKLVLRDPLPADHEIVIDEGHHGSRTYLVVTSGGLDNAAIASTEVKRGWQGRPEIEVVLTPDGRRKFADMTTRAVGRKITVVVDDGVVSAPLILSPIDKGRMYLLGDLDPDADPAKVKRDLEDLSAVLRSGPLPAPIRLKRHLLYGQGGPIGRQGPAVASSRPLVASQSRRLPSW
jgi:preprotein translocase subunit SecD